MKAHLTPMNQHAGCGCRLSLRELLASESEVGALSSGGGSAHPPIDRQHHLDPKKVLSLLRVDRRRHKSTTWRSNWDEASSNRDCVSSCLWLWNLRLLMRDYLLIWICSLYGKSLDRYHKVTEGGKGSEISDKNTVCRR